MRHGAAVGSPAAGSGRPKPMTETPPDPSDADLRPGDEARPGTGGAGETLCPECSGSGHGADGSACHTCSGTGRIVAGLGGT